MKKFRFFLASALLLTGCGKFKGAASGVMNSQSLDVSTFDNQNLEPLTIDMVESAGQAGHLRYYTIKGTGFNPNHQNTVRAFCFRDASWIQSNALEIQLIKTYDGPSGDATQDQINFALDPNLPSGNSLAALLSQPLFEDDGPGRCKVSLNAQGIGTVEDISQFTEHMKALASQISVPQVVTTSASLTYQDQHVVESSEEGGGGTIQVPTQQAYELQCGIRINGTLVTDNDPECSLTAVNGVGLSVRPCQPTGVAGGEGIRFNCQAWGATGGTNTLGHACILRPRNTYAPSAKCPVERKVQTALLAQPVEPTPTVAAPSFREIQMTVPQRPDGGYTVFAQNRQALTTVKCGWNNIQHQQGNTCYAYRLNIMTTDSNNSTAWGGVTSADGRFTDHTFSTELRVGQNYARQEVRCELYRASKSSSQTCQQVDYYQYAKIAQGTQLWFDVQPAPVVNPVHAIREMGFAPSEVSPGKFTLYCGYGRSFSWNALETNLPCVRATHAGRNCTFKTFVTDNVLTNKLAQFECEGSATGAGGSAENRCEMVYIGANASQDQRCPQSDQEANERSTTVGSTRVRSTNTLVSAILSNPGGLLTREQAAVLLINRVEPTIQNFSQDPYFGDVPKVISYVETDPETGIAMTTEVANPYFPYIQRLWERRITAGCVGGSSAAERRFCPSPNLTRIQAVIFRIRVELGVFTDAEVAARAQSINPDMVYHFSDIDTASSTYQWIRLAILSGMVAAPNEASNESFRPNDPATVSFLGGY